MNRHILAFTATILLACGSIAAQTASQDCNYVRTRTYIKASAADYVDDIVYYDGLGRESQRNSVSASPDGKDIVLLTEYDDLGRVSRQWLPVPMALSGGYAGETALYAAARESYSDSLPYTMRSYEQSPESRLKEEWQPGASFRTGGASVSNEYLTNSASGILSCRDVRLVSGTGTGESIGVAGQAPARTLAVARTLSPDGGETYVFTDYRERILLVRQVLSDSTDRCADTYYVYDDRDRLRFVLPPELSAALPDSAVLSQDSDVFRKYGYGYGYDSRGRCTEKKLPGAEAVYYGYDRADRMILSQDGMQRSRGEWTVNIPDRFGRVVIEGTVDDGLLSRTSFAGQSVYAEFDEEETSTWCYRTDNGPDLSEIDIRNVFYYDGYAFRDALPEFFGGLGCTDSGYSGEVFNDGDDPVKSKGLLTGRITTDMTAGGTVLGECLYYDRYDRVVQKMASYSGTVHKAEYTVYDFRGNVTDRRTEVTQGGKTDTLSVSLSYDDRDRLVSETSVLDGEYAASVAYGYDPFGRLESMGHGIGGDVSSVGYEYNLRGWTTGIASDAFSMRLSYEAPQDGAPMYSGNISEWEWRTEDGQPDAYVFTYDRLHRLTDAEHYTGGEPSGEYSERGISYDLNGNILSLERYAGGMFRDSLGYSYSGNRLMSVSGASGVNSEGYAYDLNGNMVYNGVNGLEMDYNRQNLLDGIYSSDGETVADYAFLADGTKLSVTDGSGEGLGYYGPLVYRISDSGMSLESAEFSGGRFVRDGNSDSGGFRTRYHITDHLGSVRAVVDGDGEVVERNSFYPTGIRWDDGSQCDSTNRYRFSGKEEQFVFGVPYIDYGARMYDPYLGRWTAQDPLAEQYYSTSPYAFCAGNPVKFVDLDGMDIWEVDNRGHIVNRIEDKTQDTFYIVQKTGNNSWERTENEISFEYGTFKNDTEATFFEGNDDASAELFKFLADNTMVEIGMITTLNSGSVVFTDNITNKIDMMKVGADIEAKGIGLQTFVHSHPNNPFPSGFFDSNGNVKRQLEGDKLVAHLFDYSHGKPVNHFVYTPKYNLSVDYNLVHYDNERIIDFIDFYLVY